MSSCPSEYDALLVGLFLGAALVLLFLIMGDMLDG